jgi:hypothetical protein
MHKRVLVVAPVAISHSLVSLATMHAMLKDLRIATTTRTSTMHARGGSIVVLFVICVTNVQNAAATPVNKFGTTIEWMLRGGKDKCQL